MAESYIVRIVVATIVVLGALLVFFFAPIVPHTFTNFDPFSSSFSGYFGTGSGFSATASVSPSYSVFHCGEVWNPRVSINYLGFPERYVAWTGGQWLC